jgi:hypothetical protein
MNRFQTVGLVGATLTLGGLFALFGNQPFSAHHVLVPACALAATWFAGAWAERYRSTRGRWSALLAGVVSAVFVLAAGTGGVLLGNLPELLGNAETMSSQGLLMTWAGRPIVLVLMVGLIPAILGGLACGAIVAATTRDE